MHAYPSFIPSRTVLKRLYGPKFFVSCSYWQLRFVVLGGSEGTLYPQFFAPLLALATQIRVLGGSEETLYPRFFAPLRIFVVSCSHWQLRFVVRVGSEGTLYPRFFAPLLALATQNQVTRWL
jgi:hypothetical protein